MKTESTTAWRLAATCPACGAELLVKVNRKSQESFVGCTAWPACAFTEGFDVDVQALGESLLGEAGRLLATQRQKVDRELLKIIALAHPDRWPDNRLAHELTQALIDLRRRLADGGV